MTVTVRQGVGALNARADDLARHQRTKMTEQERRLMERYTSDTSLRLSRVTGPSSVPSSLSSSSSSSSWSQRSRKGRDRSNLLEPLDKENAGVTGRFSKSSENVRNRRNGDYRNDKNNSNVIQRRYQSHSPNKTVKTNLNPRNSESRHQKENSPEKKKSNSTGRHQLQPQKSLSRTRNSVSKSNLKSALFPLKNISKLNVKEKRSPIKFAPKAGLVQCKSCSRNFAEERIQTHVVICKKTKSKKRKPFDATKARVEGTEAAQYQGKNSSSSNNKNKPRASPPKSDWRKKREEFILSLRAAKEAGKFLARGGDPRDLPPPSDVSDYIQCQYCQRRFAQNVAERHIPKCKNIQSNKSTNKRGRK